MRPSTRLSSTKPVVTNNWGLTLAINTDILIQELRYRKLRLAENNDGDYTDEEMAFEDVIELLQEEQTKCLSS